MADENAEGLSNAGLSDELEKGLAAAAEGEVEATENDQNREPEVEAAQTQVEPAKEQPAAAPQVNEWEQKYKDLEARLVTESNTLAQRGYDELIKRAAAKNAAAYEALTGEKPPPDMFPAAQKPADPNAKPEDALKAEIAELKQWRAQQETERKQAAERQKYEAIQADRAEKLYQATDKFKDVYEHPHFGEQMTALLTNEFIKVSADPKAVVDPAQLAEKVAKQFRAAVEWEKQKYVKGKQEVAAKIPAGAGPAGGRQPGPVKVEADLTSRRGRASLAKAMADHVGAGESE